MHPAPMHAAPMHGHSVSTTPNTSPLPSLLTSQDTITRGPLDIVGPPPCSDVFKSMDTVEAYAAGDPVTLRTVNTLREAVTGMTQAYAAKMRALRASMTVKQDELNKLKRALHPQASSSSNPARPEATLISGAQNFSPQTGGNGMPAIPMLGPPALGFSGVQMPFMGEGMPVQQSTAPVGLHVPVRSGDVPVGQTVQQPTMMSTRLQMPFIRHSGGIPWEQPVAFQGMQMVFTGEGMPAVQPTGFQGMQAPLTSEGMPAEQPTVFQDVQMVFRSEGMSAEQPAVLPSPQSSFPGGDHLPYGGSPAATYPMLMHAAPDAPGVPDQGGVLPDVPPSSAAGYTATPSPCWNGPTGPSGSLLRLGARA